MSFALLVKEEVLSKELSKDQAYALVCGVASTSYISSEVNTIVKINNSNILNSIKNLLHQASLDFSIHNDNKNWIILNNFELEPNTKHPGQYFGGVFVGGGSVSNLESKSYHLEIQLHSNQQATLIQNFLNKYSFNFTKIQRRKMWVLYIKKSDQISDFLKSIEAFNSLLNYEDIRIQRDFKNQLNRYSNLDILNQQKLADFSNEFMELYTYVKENNLESNFKEDELTFFEIKKDNLYSSLSELVELLAQKGIKKTRGGLNHWMIKLRKIVNSNF